MDQAAESNFVAENQDIAPESSSERVAEVMDSNEIVVNLVIDMQPNYMNNETVLGSSSEGVIEVMDSNEIAVNLVPDIQSNYMKNKTESAKSKIKNDKSKEMTVASLPERKSLKRGAVHPPTSEMVMDAIKALKKRNGASFEDMRKYLEEKYVVDMKRLKFHVDKFLQKSVGDGVIEKIDRGGAEGRFKIKKSEDIKKGSKNVSRKEGKGKPKMKMAATKKQVKK